MTNITYDEWLETYKPITDKHGNIRTFETFGEDLEIVKVVDNQFLWTWVDGGDYSGYSTGFSFVNRMCYFVCTVPWTDDNLYVDIYEPDACEESGHEFEVVKRYDGNSYECCKHCGEDKAFLEMYDE
jgi:hypothetical protein